MSQGTNRIQATLLLKPDDYWKLCALLKHYRDRNAPTWPAHWPLLSADWLVAKALDVLLKTTRPGDVIIRPNVYLEDMR